MIFCGDAGSSIKADNTRRKSNSYKPSAENLCRKKIACLKSFEHKVLDNFFIRLFPKRKTIGNIVKGQKLAGT